MIRIHTPLAVARLATVAALGAASLLLSPAWADSQYQQDRANCMSGSSGQDRATCMKEAAAAQHERRQGGVDTYGGHSRNAVARCEAMPAADRADCMARITGKTSTNRRVKTTGSVAGGGILRETTTTTVVPAPAASGAMK